MRLAALLAELPDDQLERLGLEHLGDDEKVSRASLCATLESVLRSYSFVRKFVSDRLPPTFSIFETLLDSPSCACPVAEFRDQVNARTKALVDRIASGDLLARDSGLRLYRRVLLEARRNDLVLDAGETAILGVLRRELGIRSVEHFIIEHHSDFHEFWSRDTAFLDAFSSLRSSGLLFAHGGNVLLAEEVVPLVRQTFGFEMTGMARRRLFERLSGAEVADVLGRAQLKASGSKDEKLERLLTSYVQPSEVLKSLSLQSLRDIARDARASVSGSKDDLVDRLVDHFLRNLDIVAPTEAPVPRVAEQRLLPTPRMKALFASLKGDDLTDILAAIDSSRITGAKETKIALLDESPYNEETLLGHLTNRALEETLARNRLRTAGSKHERIERLLEHYRTIPESMLGIDVTVSGGPESASPHGGSRVE